jgi:hypothetical protein
MFSERIESRELFFHVCKNTSEWRLSDFSPSPKMKTYKFCEILPLRQPQVVLFLAKITKARGSICKTTFVLLVLPLSTRRRGPLYKSDMAGTIHSG